MIGFLHKLLANPIETEAMCSFSSALSQPELSQWQGF